MDIVGMVINFSNPWSWIGVAFDFLWMIFTTYLLTRFPWWEEPVIMGQFAFDVTLPVFTLNLVGAIASGLIGYEALVGKNCAPQIL